METQPPNPHPEVGASHDLNGSSHTAIYLFTCLQGISSHVMSFQVPNAHMHMYTHTLLFITWAPPHMSTRGGGVAVPTVAGLMEWYGWHATHSGQCLRTKHSDLLEAESEGMPQA